MKFWQISLLAVLLIAVCALATNRFEGSFLEHTRSWSGPVGHDPKVHNEIHDYLLKGEYIIIGKRFEGDQTYHGKVKLSRDGDKLIMTRQVDGRQVTAKGYIDHGGLAPDHIHFLHYNYEIDGGRYGASYQWSTVIGHWARISGYVYRLGKKRKEYAMETMFRQLPKPE